MFRARAEMMRWLAATCCLGMLQFAGSPAAASDLPEQNAQFGRIVAVEHARATDAFIPRPEVVSLMMRAGLRHLSGESDLGKAVRSLVSTQEVVGIKVYSTPGKLSGTRPAVVSALVQCLIEAGFPRKNIIIWDKRLLDLKASGYVELAERLQVRILGSEDAGYDEKAFYERPLVGRLVFGDLEFGQKGEGIGRKSFVSKVLTQEVTRIINVTPLLNHNLMGVSGVMFGLTFGGMDNTLRFEQAPSQLAEALPEMYVLPQLGERVVLNIVDALICQYQGEERTLLHYSAALNQLWLSKDPVALDVLGIAELQKQRRVASGKEAHIDAQIYENAALLDLGQADPRKIQIERLRLGEVQD